MELGVGNHGPREVGWSKATELIKVPHRDSAEFDCATWLYKAKELPKEDFKRAVDCHLTGKETEPCSRRPDDDNIRKFTRGPSSSPSQPSSSPSQPSAFAPPQRRGVACNLPRSVSKTLPERVLQPHPRAEGLYPSARARALALALALAPSHFVFA